MAKLVDAWDLKSPARKGVPVRFRLRAPSKIKGLRAKANANPCLFLLRQTTLSKLRSQPAPKCLENLPGALFHLQLRDSVQRMPEAVADFILWPGGL